MASPRAYWRFVVVAWQFLPLLASYARDRHRFLLFGRGRTPSAERRRRRAERLLDSLLTLGPTFIKLGQLLSSRPDVLPSEYVDVLAELQDQVPPAEWSAARRVIEAELGPVEEAFEAFDTEAISGASLGQVYTATLDGERVAVKVRRPGIEPLVEADLRALRWALPVVLLFVDDARAFSLENLASEFAKTLRQEMDYVREAAILTEIRGNFAGDDRIVIPEVRESRSSERVLTMEYVPGTKITDLDALDGQGIDRKSVAETLERAYFQMIIEDGVFHADPHPGNLAVQSDGTVVFYDFGMSGYVDEEVQDRIVEFYVAVANQDIETILDTLVAMGTLSPEADRATMADVMELAIRDARGEDIDQYRVQQIVEKVEDTIYEFPLRLPSNLALVLRVATVVEGVCVTLDPDFDFVAVATDFLREEGYYARGAREFVDEAAGQLAQSVRASTRIAPKLDRALDRIDRDDLYVRTGVEDPNAVLDALARRLVTGVVFAAGLVGTALVYAAADLRATVALGAVTAVAGLLCWRSFRRRRGVGATPQFTRQSMRERER